MPVTGHRSTSTDLARGLAVVGLAVVQIVVAGLGGRGALGEDVGTVARSYPTLVLPAGWTFAIWGPIYLAFLGYAIYQVLPAQRIRRVHRTTGWWLAISASAPSPGSPSRTPVAAVPAATASDTHPV